VPEPAIAAHSNEKDFAAFASVAPSRRRALWNVGGQSDAVAVSGLFGRLVGAHILRILSRGCTHLGAIGGLAPLFGRAVAGASRVDITIELTGRHCGFSRTNKKGHHLCRVMALKT